MRAAAFLFGVLAAVGLTAALLLVRHPLLRVAAGAALEQELAGAGGRR